MGKSISYNQLVDKSKEIKQCYLDYHRRKAYVVGMPLETLEWFFKNLFSKTLGMEYLYRSARYLSERLNLPSKTFKFPSVSYLVINSRDYSRIHRMLDINYVSSRFVRSTQSFVFTPLTTPFFPFYYLFRNLGKVASYLIASIYTIPATLAIKSYYKLKGVVKYISYNRAFNKISEKELLDGMLNRDNDRIQKHVAKKMTANDMISSLFQSVTSGGANYNKIKNLAKSLMDARVKKIKSRRRGRLAKTIFLGIVFPPSLFFTVPSFKKHKYQDERELKLIDETSKYLNASDSIDSTTLYKKGMEFLEEGDRDLAYLYLKNIPEDANEFKSAMFEVGNILMTNGYADEANVYFDKAGDSDMSAITDELAKKRDPLRRHNAQSTSTSSTSTSVVAANTQSNNHDAIRPVPSTSTESTTLLSDSFSVTVFGSVNAQPNATSIDEQSNDKAPYSM